LRPLNEGRLEVADLPPSDIASWLSVRSGLVLMRRTLLAVFLGIPLFFLLIPSSIGLRWLGWPGSFGLILMGVYYLSLPFLFLFGLGMCCRTPVESGAKRYAQAAFVLALTTFGMISIMLSVHFLHLNRVLPHRWIAAISRSDDLGNIVGLMLLLNTILGVMCVLLFFQAVARTLHQGQATHRALDYLWLLSPWAVGLTLYSFATDSLISSLIIPCLILCLAGIKLLSAAERTIGKAIPYQVMPTQPPLDVVAWRRVQLGLMLVRLSLVAAFLAGSLSIILFVPALIDPTFFTSLDFPRWPFLAVAMFFKLCLPLLLLSGIYLCCFAPASSGARAPAQMSLVLALAAAGMTSDFWVFLV